MVTDYGLPFVVIFIKLIEEVALEDLRKDNT